MSCAQGSPIRPATFLIIAWCTHFSLCRLNGKRSHLPCFVRRKARCLEFQLPIAPFLWRRHAFSTEVAVDATCLHDSAPSCPLLQAPDSLLRLFPRSAGSFVRCEALKTMAAMGHLPRQVDTLLFDLRVKFLVHLCSWHRFEISNWTRGTSSRMDPLALESIDGSAKTKGRRTVVSRHDNRCHPLSSQDNDVRMTRWTRVRTRRVVSLSSTDTKRFGPRAVDLKRYAELPFVTTIGPSLGPPRKTPPNRSALPGQSPGDTCRRPGSRGPFVCSNARGEIRRCRNERSPRFSGPIRVERTAVV